MSTLFTKIIRGELPSIKLAENDYVVAIMDMFPLRNGHVLIIPRKEVDLIYDLEDFVISELMKMTKRIAKAMKKTIPCERIGMSVLGLEVPHAHIHLIPMNSNEDLNFNQPKLSQSQEEIQEIANKIIENIRR